MLLGREPEQEALERLLADAREGRSGVLALVGEAGIGKSTLLEYTASLASGTRLLRARGIASEEQIPFAGLFELLRPALGQLDRIPEPQAAALQSALALRPAQAQDRFAVGAATLSLLAACAEDEPVTVLVDDVHSLDGSTDDALLFAFRRLLAEPIAVVLTAREGEPSLLDGADLPTLQLGGLDSATAALLLASADESTAIRLHRETGGNPLAMLELAREPLPGLVPDTPVPVLTSVAQTYADQAAALPERTQHVLVLGAATDLADLSVLARAAERLDLTLADLEPAEETGLVTARDGLLEFRHPLARSAIYAAATSEQRRRTHRALAETLPDADADRRAWHLALAAEGPDAAASSALAQAAERARARSAYDVSSEASERAARLAASDERRTSLLFDAAEAAWLGGLADRAVALLEEAALAADGTPLALRIDHLRGHIAVLRGPLVTGAALLAASAERADPETAVVMLAEAVVGGFFAADGPRMLESGRRAGELVSDDAGTRTVFFGRIAEGMALVMAGEGERGAAAIREAVAILERSDELRADTRLLALASMGPLWLREAGGGRELVDRAVAVARSRSAAGALPHLLSHLAIMNSSTDRWVDAQAEFDEAIRLAQETGQSVVLAGALARLAGLDARTGRADECRDHAAEALAIAREQGVGLAELWALAALCDLELALGDAQAVLERARERREVIMQHGVADPDLSPAPEEVEAYLRLGRAGDAAEAFAPFERAAEEKGQPWALARAARCRALLADDGDADRAFDAALALHAETPDTFETARTELAYGGRLRRAGERVRARERLRAALDAFDDLGAVPWADATRAELAATGERVRPRDPSRLGDLTPQELQIALLLAEGRTTREAAAAMFLSPKTIEYHLRNAYRKLGIHSRDELRAAMASRRRQGDRHAQSDVQVDEGKEAAR
jgi:DNA-binding CsgD family transcriptional regulator